MARLYHDALQKILVDTTYGQQILNFAWHHALREWALRYNIKWLEYATADPPYYEFPNHLEAIRLKLQWNAKFVEHWWHQHLYHHHEHFDINHKRITPL